MIEREISWKRLALGIGVLVLLLGILAWFDKPECVVTTGQQASRHVALVVDRSGSMGFIVKEVVDNVNAVLDSLQPSDRVSIIFF